MTETTTENTVKTTVKTPTPISKKGLTTDVTNGLKLDALMSKYGTTKQEMNSLLKEAGLKIKRTKAKRFILTDDVNLEANTTETLN